MRVLVTACLLGSALMLSACQTTSNDKDVDKTTKTSSVKKSTKKTTTSKSTASGYTASPYDKLIQKHAKKNGVPVSLARAVVQIESELQRKCARGCGRGWFDAN
ncbi:hypothetical protein RT723_06315 [Psychrosphaera aquimarina]|uniref:Uncharacterized protein n=1 Tax=Psychrosphaera aquimarina TaxID=2044854 RepID=A0ABU3QYW7_9GAMM|nr:hypothetical protein [Psychrosphaera aquimarina]MDU0112622.1 hypothetical protein [Psychrosphaera aquimarina]